MTNWESVFNDGLGHFSKQQYHAAFDVWEQLGSLSCSDPTGPARLHSHYGTAYIHLGDNAKAVQHFSTALSFPCSPELHRKYTMNLALAYRLTDPDRSHRLMTDIMGKVEEDLPKHAAAPFYANLGTIQGLNGFYEQAKASIEKSLIYFRDSGVSDFDAPLLHNIGVLHMELGHIDIAKEYLLKAYGIDSGLSTVLELSRAYFLSGDTYRSIAFANEAFPLVWSSMMSFERDDIARLCRLLAQLAHSTGEQSIALRLLEKSQLLFGQIEMWQEWMNAQTVMDTWAENSTIASSVSKNFSLENIHRFLNLLDVLHSQELIDEKFSQLLDTRVSYATALGEALHLNSDELRDLSYACRFADYGLTAIEPEVLENPHRSPQAWEQYTQHPALSVEMLTSLWLAPSVIEIVGEHHENFDGSGFPNQKKGHEISRSAQILAIADFYASGVTVDGQPHSSTLKKIRDHSGRLFEPSIADTFSNLFADGESATFESASVE